MLISRGITTKICGWTIVSILIFTFAALVVVLKERARNKWSSCLPEKLDKETAKFFQENSNKTTVQLYYESLCPYSRDYIVDDFYPTMIELGKYINYELIPFGNAKTNISFDPESQKIQTTFHCQHGPKECDGNMIQACAIQKYRSSHGMQTLEFIKCMMERGFPQNGTYVKPEQGSVGKICAKVTKLDWEPVYTCWKGQEGIDLEKVMAEKTKSKDHPKIDGVPTIFLNGEGDMDELRNNLFGYICNKIQEQVGQKVHECCELN